jgi:signal transduction histidine kinase/CheY-like chemotaxis protein/HPt (histidine-containing phosphotransfer) domain-containing protein
LLVVVLGGVHAYLGYLGYTQLRQQNERSMRERVDRIGQSLDAQFQRSGEELTRLAAQLGATTSTRQIAARAAPRIALSPELLAALTRVEFDTPDGDTLAAWDAAGPYAHRPADTEALIARVRRIHQPVTQLVCAQDCRFYAFVPVFDPDGKELVVVIGQLAADVLQAFRQVIATDAALLVPDAARGGSGSRPGALHIWGRRVEVLTNAPLLKPVLMAARVSPPPPHGSAQLESNDHQYLLRLHPLPPELTDSHSGMEVLFVLDDTQAQIQIATDLHHVMLTTLTALAVSALLLTLLAGPLLRKLSRITAALPLLAEQRFAEARRLMRETPRRSWLSDEVDVLHATAVGLASELERLNAAESASEAKSLFLATMSHEIRTPLNAIIGSAELLADSAMDLRQKDLLETIQSSGTHLLSVISDILDFSKIEAGKLELESRAFEVRRCVEESLELVAHRATQKGLELTYVYAGQVPDALVGDGGRVKQILANYLSNAVKFTEQGEVVVTVTGRPLADGERCEIEFAVRDTGIGIPAERRDRLFKAFSQVDPSTTRSFGGTGLGLVIAKRLAEMMGGRVWVESEPGRGSTFCFTIVGGISTLPQAADDLPDPQLLRGRRVLVVDDNAANRQLLRANAEAWGMRVMDTDSSLEALGWIRAGELFDVGLIDYMLPELDGPALATAIHRHSALPLVLLTSSGMRGKSGEFAMVLNKPVRRAALLDALQTVFGGGRSEPTLGELAAEPLESFASLRVLLAEDNPVNQKVAMLMLESLGCRADFADDGAVAVHAAQLKDYDLILMDVQMPIMDGLEATRRIREQRGPGHQPRIVAITAGAFERDRDECIAAGMDDYATKPIQRERLLELLREAMATRDAAGASGQRVEAAAEDSGEQGDSGDHAPPRLHEIDSAVIANLRQTLGPAGALELWDALIEEAPRLLQGLTAGAAGEDVKALRFYTHTLSDHAAMLGATKLSALCKQLQDTVVANPAAGAALAITMAQHYQRLIDDVARLHSTDARSS